MIGVNFVLHKPGTFLVNWDEFALVWQHIRECQRGRLKWIWGDGCRW